MTLKPRVIVKFIVFWLFIVSLIGTGIYLWFFLKKSPLKSLEEPHIEVKNNGLDPQKPQDKKVLESFQLPLMEGEVLNAKILVRKVTKKEKLEEGSDFIIFDFRKETDYERKRMEYSENVTKYNFLEYLNKYDTSKIIYLISYKEVDDDIKFGIKACLLQGYFNILGIKGGFESWERLDT